MIIVTGGMGFIGANLVKALLKRGEKVTIFDTEHRGYLYEHFEYTKLDFIRIPNDPPPEFDGVKAVFHLGGISSTTETDREAIYAYNINPTLMLYQKCKECAIPFIYASSASVYGNGENGFSENLSWNKLTPMNEYAHGKAVIDSYFSDEKAQAELPGPKHWYGLRFFNVYGPYETHKGEQRSVISKFYDALKAGQKVEIFGNARSSKRDFIHVDDCVNVMLWLFDNLPQSGIYNVGTGRAETFLDVASTMIKLYTGVSSGWLNDLKVIDMPDNVRSHYQHFTQADISKLRSFGYTEPMTNIVDGISKYIERMKVI